MPIERFRTKLTQVMRVEISETKSGDVLVRAYCQPWHEMEREEVVEFELERSMPLMPISLSLNLGKPIETNEEEKEIEYEPA